MGKFVQPKVYLTGFTDIHYEGLEQYLRDTDQLEFIEDLKEARNAGISGGECLCSFAAKLCYKSLKVGKNANVRKVRSVEENLKSCFETSHGSVFEHANLNFVITDCSRVLTHELVRHRAGTAFSQTSGRYCRLDSIDLVLDPILKDAEYPIRVVIETIEMGVYTSECLLGLRKPNPLHPEAPFSKYEELTKEGRAVAEEYKWVPDDSFDFEKRKKITSAIRRIAPNGQSNEIGFTANIRALRHMVQLRTSRHAEWEIRSIFAQVYNITRSKFPMLWWGMRTKIVDNILMVYGAKSNPYDVAPGDPKALEFWSTESLKAELDLRA